MLQKAASAQEAAQVNNLERIVLVYDLMMKNVIEQKGSWPHDGQPFSTEKNLKVLVDKISSELDTAPRLIRDTLNHALHQGDIICREADGMVRWHWVDYICKY